MFCTFSTRGAAPLLLLPDGKPTRTAVPAWPASLPLCLLSALACRCGLRPSAHVAIPCHVSRLLLEITPSSLHRTARGQVSHGVFVTGTRNRCHHPSRNRSPLPAAREHGRGGAPLCPLPASAPTKLSVSSLVLLVQNVPSQAAVLGLLPPAQQARPGRSAVSSGLRVQGPGQRAAV